MLLTARPPPPPVLMFGFSLLLLTPLLLMCLFLRLPEVGTSRRLDAGRNGRRLPSPAWRSWTVAAAPGWPGP